MTTSTTKTETTEGGTASSATSNTIASPESLVPTEPEAPPATDVILLSANDPPPFPTVVSGYVPDGPVSTQQFRIFSGQAVTTLGFGSSAGACFRGYWVARWRSFGGPVKANVAGGGADQGIAASDLPPVEAGQSGYMAGSLCAQPVFYTDEPLVDVVAEYQAYTPTVDTDSGVDHISPTSVVVTTVSPESKAYECGGYTPAFDLPLKPCDSGRTVAYVQQRLVELGYPVEADGEFGYATQVAVLRYQTSEGLEPDGLVGRVTWAKLMAGYGLPGLDENYDGVISPDELGE